SREIPIGQLVREGQMLVVQVVKEPIATKGARLTTHLSLASRHMVYMPRNKHLGISQRIESEEERARLLALREQCLEQEGLLGAAGFILRTAAEGASGGELGSDIRFLRRLWNAVDRRIQESREVKVLYRDLVLYVRAMRDLIKPQVEKIRIDDRRTCEEVLE